MQADGVPIEQYIGRTLDGVAESSHVRKDNYFYYNCLTGHFLRDNCPTYLQVRAFGRCMRAVPARSASEPCDTRFTVLADGLASHPLKLPAAAVRRWHASHTHKHRME